jgi:toxin ParE1/3/4
MASFRLRKAARADLVRIGVESRKGWGDAQMRRYLADLDRAFHTLAEMPLIGHAADEVKPDYRCLREGRHLIFYKLTEAGDVDIIRILHARMAHETHLDDE